MLRVDDTSAIDMTITGRIAEWFILVWKRLTGQIVPLLPEFEYLKEEPAAVRYVARKRRRCTLVGHIWEFKEIQMDRVSYVVECFRCHPHIDSRRVIVSYNPFPTVERKTD